MSFMGRFSRLARPRVATAIAGAAAAAILLAALVVAVPGSPRRKAVTVAPSTTTPTLPFFVGPSTTTPPLAQPTDTEPSVPATPTAPAATPLLTSNAAAAPVFYRLHLSSPVVFVTIDDGWVRDPRVIGFLGQTGWPISIFLIERAAAGDPNYFRQMSAAGATIEDHTYDHPYLTSLGPDRQTYEVCRPVHDYAGLLGHTPTLLRPPYGAWNPTTQKVAHGCGLGAVVEWSATMSAGRLAVAGQRLRGGDIILLHFTPTLYSDLVTLRSILAADGLSVGRLESYLSSETSGGSTVEAVPTSATSQMTTTSVVPANPNPAPSSTTTTTPTTAPPGSTPPTT